MRFEEAKKKWRNDAPDNFPVRMVDCEIAFAAGWNAGLTEAEKVAENICNRPSRPGEPPDGMCHVKELQVKLRTLRTDNENRPGLEHQNKCHLAQKGSCHNSDGDVYGPSCCIGCTCSRGRNDMTLRTDGGK